MACLAFALAAPTPSVPPAGVPQDDPVETRDDNIEFLLRPVHDRPGEGFGLDQDSMEAGIASDERGSGPLPGPDLVRLIKGGVSSDTWDREKTKIEYAKGNHTVTHRRSVQEMIRQYLGYLHDFFGRRIVVDVAIVAVDPSVGSGIFAVGESARPAVLSPERRRKVMEASREGKSAEVIKTCRLSADPGQRVNLEDVVRQSYVADHDVQINSADALLDPILDVFATGTGVDIRPFLGPGAVAWRWRYALNTRNLRGWKNGRSKLPRRLPRFPVRRVRLAPRPRGRGGRRGLIPPRAPESAELIHGIRRRVQPAGGRGSGPGAGSGPPPGPAGAHKPLRQLPSRVLSHGRQGIGAGVEEVPIRPIDLGFSTGSDGSDGAPRAAGGRKAGRPRASHSQRGPRMIKGEKKNPGPQGLTPGT